MIARIATWCALAACFAGGATVITAGPGVPIARTLRDGVDQGVGQTPSPLPLSQSIRERGTSVTGAYEGWFYGKDGATYALFCGLREGMPFTHLAPACGVLHPALFVNGDLARAQGRPIYLVHGTLDWMFPIASARLASQALQTAGARLVYREIEDLSHTSPRDENPKILDWLMGEAPPTA